MEWVRLLLTRREVFTRRESRASLVVVVVVAAAVVVVFSAQRLRFFSVMFERVIVVCARFNSVFVGCRRYFDT